MPKISRTHIVCFLLCCAFSLRIWAINHGLPFFINSNEAIHLPRAMEILRSRQFNPHYFINPPFLIYLDVLTMVIYFAIGKFLCIFHSFPDFYKLYTINPAPYFIISRVIAVLFGTATCLMVYKIASKLFTKTAGIIACALMSFCFLHSSNSHFAINDIPALFFITLAFNYAVNIYLKGRMSDYLFAGLSFGLAIVTKYNAGVVILPLLAAHFLQAPENKAGRGKKIIFSILSCLFAFLLVCPWVFLDYKSFLSGIISQYYISKHDWICIPQSNSYLFYIKTVIWGYGLLPFIFSLIGFVFLRSRIKELFILIIFPLVYFLFMGSSRLFFIRYALPLLPFLCVSSAYGIIRTAGYFGQKGNSKAVIFLTILCLLQGIIFNIRYNYLIGKTDTRIIAREWIINNIPAGSKIAMENLSKWVPSLRDYEHGGVINNYKPYIIDLPEHDIEYYKLNGYQYILTSDFIRMRYQLYPQRYDKQIRFYNHLGKEIYSILPAQKKLPYYIDEVYSPFWNIFLLDKPGPVIRIYRI